MCKSSSHVLYLPKHNAAQKSRTGTTDIDNCSLSKIFIELACGLSIVQSHHSTQNCTDDPGMQLFNKGCPVIYRPVTLIGYSMGARLVYHCLLELCRFNCKSLVEHAVLLGCTVTIVKERFTMARSVVSGRFVNAYSSQDWLLGLLFRSTSGFIRPAAGLCPVDVPGVENADLSDTVRGHFDYIRGGHHSHTAWLWTHSC